MSQKLPDCFPKWLYHFSFLWAVCESSSGSTFLVAYAVVRFLFWIINIMRYLTVDLIYNCVWPTMMSIFLVVICHHYLFSDRSVQIFCQLFNRVICFLIIISPSCIMDTSYFPNICFANIFSWSVIYLFIFLLACFADQKFLFWICPIYKTLWIAFFSILSVISLPNSKSWRFSSVSPFKSFGFFINICDPY